MNNYFYFDVCAFIILVTLICSTIFRKITRGRTNKLFISELICSTISVLAKMLSTKVFFIMETNVVSRILTYLLLHIYYSSLIFMMLFAALYIFSSVGIWFELVNEKILTLFILGMVCIPNILLIINYFVPVFYYINENFEIIYNYRISVIYVFMLMFLILCFVLLWNYKEFVPRVKLIFGFTLCFINTSCLVLQHFHNEAQIYMFVISMSCYLLSITTQRPELLVNPLINAKSIYSFIQEVQRSYAMKRPMTLIYIKIVNHRVLEVYIGQKNYTKYLNKVANYLNNLSTKEKLNCDSYYLDNSLFVISVESNKKNLLMNIISNLEHEALNKTEIEGIEISAEFCSVVVNCPEDISNYDYLSYFSRKFHHVLPKSNKVLYMKDYSSSEDFKIRNEIDSILQRAVKDNNFEVYYQPVYGVKENRFVSAEALLRLKDPEYGYISPSIFLPVAERNGLIYQIGNFVISEVCRFVGSSSFSRLHIDNIQINLSTSQCVEENLVDKILKALQENNVSPKKIRLEITERSTEINPTVVEHNIYTLHAAGIRFALDDYGIGYSNIKKTLDLPLDIVKLDKSFVDNIDDPQMWSIIQDTIHMLKSLNKEVLVEGIESEDRANLFKNLKCNDDIGCEYIQGYYFSKPLSESEFVKFLTI